MSDSKVTEPVLSGSIDPSCSYYMFNNGNQLICDIDTERHVFEIPSIDLGRAACKLLKILTSDSSVTEPFPMEPKEYLTAFCHLAKSYGYTELTALSNKAIYAGKVGECLHILSNNYGAVDCIAFALDCVNVDAIKNMKQIHYADVRKYIDYAQVVQDVDRVSSICFRGDFAKEVMLDFAHYLAAKRKDTLSINYVHDVGLANVTIGTDNYDENSLFMIDLESCGRVMLNLGGSHKTPVWYAGSDADMAELCHYTIDCDLCGISITDNGETNMSDLRNKLVENIKSEKRAVLVCGENAMKYASHLYGDTNKNYSVINNDKEASDFLSKFDGSSFAVTSSGASLYMQSNFSVTAFIHEDELVGLKLLIK